MDYLISTLMRVLTLAFLLSGLFSVSAYGDLDIANGVALGDDLTTLRTKLTSACETISEVSVSPPRFPLAEQREQHLICTGYAHEGIVFSRSVFTLADDRFVRMEAAAISLFEVRAALGEPELSYLGFDIFQATRFWLHAERNIVVWLDPDGLHPNLFAWRNPLLDSESYPELSEDLAPSLFDAFELTLEQVLSQLQARCTPLQIENIEEVWLPNQPSVQTQANCFNFPYAGFDRKIEYVYGDGKLEVVWILTAKAEEQRVRQMLVSRWGAPIINNAVWEVFAGGRISLRKDTPELLLLSDNMLPLYREGFENPD